MRAKHAESRTRRGAAVVLAAVAVAIVLAPAPLLARSSSPASSSSSGLPLHGTLSLQVENDLVENTDRHYTSGVRLSYLGQPETLPDWLVTLGAALPFFPDTTPEMVGLRIGQSMFTPVDTQRTGLIENDRPYAGWLYLGTVHVVASEDFVQRLEIDIGVVGPASAAEPSQDFAHRIIGAKRPRGWGNQLDNEPGVAVSYDHVLRNVLAVDWGGLGADLQPHAGFTVGNVYTYAAAGLTVRLGQNLPFDYGPPRINPSPPGSDFFVSPPEGGFGWYVFAGLDGRAVGRNIFLDGNTISDSHSVDKETFVGDLQAGIAVTYGRWRLAYTHVYRTREFDGQKRGDRFGAFTMSVNF